MKTEQRHRNMVLPYTALQVIEVADVKDDYTAQVAAHLGYTVDLELGRGFQAKVSAVSHMDMPGKKVALRVLLGANDLEKEQLEEEFANSTLQHNLESIVSKQGGRVPKSIAVGALQDKDEKKYPFRLTELIGNGTTLENVLHRFGPIPLPLAVDYVLHIVGVAKLLEKEGYRHRDIKPSNILINTNGDALLTDFGIACSVNQKQGNTRKGTPAFMDPYYFTKEADLQHVDMYACGVLLYNLCTKRLPFTSTELNLHRRISATVQRALKGQYRSVSSGIDKESSFYTLAVGIDKILSKVWNPDRSKRYSSTENMLGDLGKLWVEHTHPARDQVQIVKEQYGTLANGLADQTYTSKGSTRVLKVDTTKIIHRVERFR